MDRPFYRQKQSSGFSILELIVSIGVIAILATMIFAGYQKARTTSQRMTCASNMRQVWHATMLYVNENRGKLPKDAGYGDYGPHKLNGELTYGLVGRLAVTLSPYIPDSVWHDPDPLVIEYSESVGTNFGRVWRRRPLTGWLSGSPYNKDRPPDKDLLLNWEDLGNRHVFICQPIKSGSRPHGGILNVLAMDGHVEVVEYGK